MTLDEFKNLAVEDSDSWYYFDYKHLNEYCDHDTSFLDDINWSCVGLPERSGKDSTLWIGSKGAHTPCHIDTYGCNFVAQIFGRKRWLLFPPDTVQLKPSRIPYEESSIYTHINFQCSRNYDPKLIEKAFSVELDPGDVLFVPPQWWHYVENLSTAISINTWVPMATDNLARLNEMEQGTAEYGVNEMADWTQEEFLTRRANLDSAKLLESVEKESFLTYSKEIKEIPNAKNWFEEGKVAPPKDQKQCGSCWAFSTVGAVESNDAIKNNSLTRRSEQQLVDCDTKSNQGCNGGWMNDAFKYLMNNSLRTEASYPYTGKDGSCKVQRGDDGDGGIKVTKIINMKSRDEGALKQHIGGDGPTSNAIDATDLQFYRKGIMKPRFCSSLPQMLNHAVLGVGYGTDKREGNYWIFKNSWGENWGEKGFFRLKMGSNACGIANVMQGVETERVA